MWIAFKSVRDAKLFNSEKELVRTYGARNARLIIRRLADLRSAPTLADVPQTPPVRRHKLVNRREEFAVNVEHPYRLAFTPDEDSPRDVAGSAPLEKVECVLILRIEDYHGL